MTSSASSDLASEEAAVESALDAVDINKSTTREWVCEYLEQYLEGTFGVEVATSRQPDPSGVCILVTERFEFYAPVENIPVWINAERHLPVEVAG